MTLIAADHEMMAEVGGRMATSSQFPYLQPNRLEHVLFLIQFLGGDGDGSKAPKTLQDKSQLNLEPQQWRQIAEEHTEFFRVMKDSGTITLWARLFATETVEVKADDSGDETDDSSEETKVNKPKTRKLRPPLSLQEVKMLMDTALKIHEQQVKRHERWTWYITFVVGFVGTLAAGIFGLLKWLL